MSEFKTKAEYEAKCAKYWDEAEKLASDNDCSLVYFSVHPELRDGIVRKCRNHGFEPLFSPREHEVKK